MAKNKAATAVFPLTVFVQKAVFLSPVKGVFTLPSRPLASVPREASMTAAVLRLGTHLSGAHKRLIETDLSLVVNGSGAGFPFTFSKPLLGIQLRCLSASKSDGSCRCSPPTFGPRGTRPDDVDRRRRWRISRGRLPDAGRVLARPLAPRRWSAPSGPQEDRRDHVRL